MKALLASANDDVKIYQRSGSTRKEELKEERKQLMDMLRPGARELLRKHGVLLGICAAAMLIFMIGMIGNRIAYRNGYSQAEEDLKETYEARYRQQVQYYIDQQDAADLLTGDASKQAALEADAKLLARIGQGVLNTYDGRADMEDARKVMLCALCRVYDNKNFPSIRSIAAAANQPEQWWGYSEGLAYTAEVWDLALEIAGIYYDNEPMPCSTDMVFAGWTGTEIVLRNQWQANASARYF